jgi:1-deoxy-D-xylulose-5-phosphate reductoisomerase
VVLGATGSIGSQALEVISRYPEEFELLGAVAGERTLALQAALRQFPGVASVVVHPQGPVPSGVGVGEDAACQLAADTRADVVLVAGGGAAALLPTLAALDRACRLAIATKEVLVMAGELVTAAARRSGAEIVPVDSEHSAIWQCLRGESAQDVARLWLTASGGPFRTAPLAGLRDATPEMALAHPNWRMGPKVTVDSATMMNKGLEVIEAHFLFAIPYSRISVVIHPQSAVHSAVEFCDGTMVAQLGVADMRAPIALALSGGRRLPGVVPPLDLAAAGRLEFEEPDPSRFPALGMAREAAIRGGGAPAVMNAANEVAVAAFLRGELRFGEVVELVSEVTGSYPGAPPTTLEDVLAADAFGRTMATEMVGQLDRRGATGGRRL